MPKPDASSSRLNLDQASTATQVARGAQALIPEFDRRAAGLHRVLRLRAPLHQAIEGELRRSEAGCLLLAEAGCIAELTQTATDALRDGKQTRVGAVALIGGPR